MNKVLDTKLFTARDVRNIIKDNLDDILTRLVVNRSDRTFNCPKEVALDNVQQYLIKTAEATVGAMKSTTHTTYDNESGCTGDVIVRPCNTDTVTGPTGTTWEMTD